MNRVEFISDYFYTNHTSDDFFRDSFFYLKLHALFNCLTGTEIKSLYLNHAVHSKKFKQTLLNFVENNAQLNATEFSKIAKEFLDDYSKQPYSLQLSYRSFLSRIIIDLDEEIISYYFELFIKSERINDRKKAYEIAKILWNNVEHTIWSNLWEFEDINALILILNNSDSSEIARNIQKIWNIYFPRKRIKKLIIDKTSKENIKHFEFLRKSEPMFYLRALIKRRKTIEKKYLKSTVKKMVKEKQGLVFYYLGYSKDWDLLVDTINSMNTEGFSNNLFDY